ncbi:MAG TPA: hypothetical protein VGE18_02675 [Candidatus Paceibacterota bacterium]
MKKMTCRQMGGMCDEVIVAHTPDEMMEKGMDHLKVAHPDMAKSVEAMPATDPLMVEWFETFQEEWDKTPEEE